MTDPVARAWDYDSLVAGFAARKAALGLSNETVDELAGFARGHTGKLFGLRPGSGYSKSLGPMSLGTLLGALGLELWLVENAEATAQLRRRSDFTARVESQVRSAASHDRVIIRFSRRYMKRIGKAGGKAKAKMSPAKRRAIGRRLARARWARRREAMSKAGQNPVNDPGRKRPAEAGHEADRKPHPNEIERNGCRHGGTTRDGAGRSVTGADQAATEAACCPAAPLSAAQASASPDHRPPQSAGTGEAIGRKPRPSPCLTE